MNQPQSNALVFFGVTGDLAYKKIFPALQAMVKRGHLNVPVIGVARSAWTPEQLRAAHDSLEHHGGLDPAAFDKLCRLLRYVGGDYNNPATFQTIRKELGSAQRPAYYLAIPPLLFGTVVEQLAKSGCTREPASSSRSHLDMTSPRLRSLIAPCSQHLMSEAIFRIDHYLGKRPVHNMVFFRFSERDPGVVLESPVHRKCANHDGRGFRRPGSGRVLRSDGHDSRRRPKPSVPGLGQLGHGACRCARTANRCAMKRSRSLKPFRR